MSQPDTGTPPNDSSGDMELLHNAISSLDSVSHGDRVDTAIRLEFYSWIIPQSNRATTHEASNDTNEFTCIIESAMYGDCLKQDALAVYHTKHNLPFQLLTINCEGAHKTASFLCRKHNLNVIQDKNTGTQDVPRRGRKVRSEKIKMPTIREKNDNKQKNLTVRHLFRSQSTNELIKSENVSGRDESPDRNFEGHGYCLEEAAIS